MILASKEIGFSIPADEADDEIESSERNHFVAGRARCADRKLGCHDTCADYLQYRNEISEIRRNKMKKRRFNPDMIFILEILLATTGAYLMCVLLLIFA